MRVEVVLLGVRGELEVNLQLEGFKTDCFQDKYVLIFLHLQDDNGEGDCLPEVGEKTQSLLEKYSIDALGIPKYINSCKPIFILLNHFLHNLLVYHIQAMLLLHPSEYFFEYRLVFLYILANVLDKS